MNFTCCLPWFWEATDVDSDDPDSPKVLRHHRLNLDSSSVGGCLRVSMSRQRRYENLSVMRGAVASGVNMVSLCPPDDKVG